MQTHENGGKKTWEETSAEVCSLHRRRLNSKGYYYPWHPESWQACCSKAAAWIFSLKGRLFLAFSLVWLSAAQQCQMASCFLQNQSASGLGSNCTWFIGHPEGESTALHWCQRGLEAGEEFLRMRAQYVQISRVVDMSYSQCWLFCHRERQRRKEAVRDSKGLLHWEMHTILVHACQSWVWQIITPTACTKQILGVQPTHLPVFLLGTERQHPSNHSPAVTPSPASIFCYMLSPSPRDLKYMN